MRGSRDIPALEVFDKLREDGNDQADPEDIEKDRHKNKSNRGFPLHPLHSFSEAGNLAGENPKSNS
jgi:hypothetical protein